VSGVVFPGLCERRDILSFVALSFFHPFARILVPTISTTPRRAATPTERQKREAGKGKEGKDAGEETVLLFVCC